MSAINLAEIITGGKNPAKVAYYCNTQQVSYRDLFNRAASLAQGMRAIGVAKRQRVLICLYDTPAISEAFLAALSIGAIPVVVNPRFSRASFEHVLHDSAARLVLGENDNLALLDALCQLAPHNPVLMLQDSYGTPGLQIADKLDATHLHLSDFVKALDVPFAFERIGELDAAFWQYTSGTTGKPKAVQHASRTMLANTDAFARQTHGLGEHDIFYSAAKMFFGYGFGASFFFPLLLGASAVLDPFMPSNDFTVLRHIGLYRPSVFFGAPAIYAALLNHVERIKPCLPGQFTCISAGSSLPQAIFDKWQAAFGLNIYDGIGATEMGHIFIANRAGQVKSGATGIPIAGYDVALLTREEGQLRPGSGDGGILCVRGPHPDLGYWNRPQATQEKFIADPFGNDATVGGQQNRNQAGNHDAENPVENQAGSRDITPISISLEYTDCNQGWYVTGDLFSRDADGFYTYRGREDDLFKSNGIWVEPLAIENALLLQVPNLLECALVPKSDEQELVYPVLYCVFNPNTPSRRESILAVKAALATICDKHSLPREILLLDALPRNDNGKISRMALAALEMDGSKTA